MLFLQGFFIMCFAHMTSAYLFPPSYTTKRLPFFSAPQCAFCPSVKRIIKRNKKDVDKHTQKQTFIKNIYTQKVKLNMNNHSQKHPERIYKTSSLLRIFLFPPLIKRKRKSCLCSHTPPLIHLTKI